MLEACSSKPHFLMTITLYFIEPTFYVLDLEFLLKNLVYTSQTQIPPTEEINPISVENITVDPTRVVWCSGKI